MRLVQGTTAEDGNSHEKGLATFGLQLEEQLPDDGAFRIWPENEQAVNVFGHMLTQFALGDGGVVLGLKYESLPHVYCALRMGPGRQRKVFSSLQVMESAALEALNARH